MSNSYLCDECRFCGYELRPDLVCCCATGETEWKIVLSDGYEGDPKELCKFWKERA